MGTKFALEAVYAGKGDALLLHHGTEVKPRWILIDGGHHHVYEGWLGPRLTELRNDNLAHVDGRGTLPFDMLMVSHADEDHVKGLLKLLRHMDDGGATREPAAVDFAEIWFNAFDDLLATNDADRAKTQSVLRVAGTDSNSTIRLPAETRDSYEVQAVLASTKQGVELRDLAKKLSIPMNSVFDHELIRRDGGKDSKELKPVNGRSGFKMTILGPDQPRIDKARAKWAKDLEGTTAPNASLTSFDDKSPHNLASIMVLVEQSGKTMLLTGDGRGDHLVEGMISHGLLSTKDGPDSFHVDLFKLPHHGSDNNTEQITFQKITADHYVISANGEHHNPMIETLEMLEAGRAAAGLTSDYSIYFTFPRAAFELFQEQGATPTEVTQRDTLKKLDSWTLSDDRPDHCHFVYREREDLSITIDLLS